ncbi:hypothetical protein D9M69_654760 [compost metagenome]
MFCTAIALESCEPEKITRPKSLSGLKPAFSRPALGNRWPEVELGSTKAKVLPLRSATVLMPVSLWVTIWL